MKQLLRPSSQLHSRHSSKAWASLDCLLTALPITPPSRSLAVMRSNGALQMTDSRRISPQTTSSSGYHSDLSSATSANESPQSLHDITPTGLESSALKFESKRTILIVEEPIQDKPSSSSSKNLSRLSSFLRKQFERAKSKLVSNNTSKPPIPQAPAPIVTTCSKATSTTPFSHLSEDSYTLGTHPSKRQSQQQQQQQQQSRASNQDQQHRQPRQHYLSSVYQQTPFSEPVYSAYVHPAHHTQLKISPPHPKNYVSIHECYSQQQPTHRLPSYSMHNSRLNSARSHQYSSSYRRLATVANYESTSSACLSINNNNINAHRHQYYAVEPSVSYQTYHRQCHYANNNYDYARSNYAPLSDFISKPSAFKPIAQKRQQQQQQHYHHRSPYPPSFESQPDDPCDLEVAQYFRHTPQWSNPNYFDIYANEQPPVPPPRQNYAETLC